ncbi:MAG: hypothetical protein ABIH99_05695 [Candidatus Micrarchaeota archaeon]
MSRANVLSNPNGAKVRGKKDEISVNETPRGRLGALTTHFSRRSGTDLLGDFSSKLTQLKSDVKVLLPKTKAKKGTPKKLAELKNAMQTPQGKKLAGLIESFFIAAREDRTKAIELISEISKFADTNNYSEDCPKETRELLANAVLLLLRGELLNYNYGYNYEVASDLRMHIANKLGWVIPERPWILQALLESLLTEADLVVLTNENPKVFYALLSAIRMAVPSNLGKSTQKELFSAVAVFTDFVCSVSELNMGSL